MPPRVIPVPGVKQSAMRAVAYLVWPEDGDVTAAPTIERLATDRGNERDKVWSRFDHWLDGNTYPKYFHGWAEPEYRHCFVFKWNKRGSSEKEMQRLYATLFNLKQKTRALQVCLLFSHCVKYGRLTDPAQKKKAESLFVNRDVITALIKQYPDR